MTRANIYKSINWTLGTIIMIIMSLFGWLITENQIQTKQININTNRLTTLESVITVDYTKEIADLNKTLIILNTRQEVIDSKLALLIALSVESNRKLDRHIQSSIPKTP